MVSIGTLMAYTIVCGNVLTLRYSSEKRPYQSFFLVILYVILIFVTAYLIVLNMNWTIWIGPAIAAIFPAFLLFFQETVNLPSSFSVPLVPLIPLLGITSNIYMMANLTWPTWVRLAVWLVIGLLFYLVYGLRNSKLAKQQVKPKNNTTAKELADLTSPSETSSLLARKHAW